MIRSRTHPTEANARTMSNVFGLISRLVVLVETTCRALARIQLEIVMRDPRQVELAVIVQCARDEVQPDTATSFTDDLLVLIRALVGHRDTAFLVAAGKPGVAKQRRGRAGRRRRARCWRRLRRGLALLSLTRRRRRRLRVAGLPDRLVDPRDPVAVMIDETSAVGNAADRSRNVHLHALPVEAPI